MIISSEKKSDLFLEVNNCGKQFLADWGDCAMLREKGRVDYHILYITAGICYTEIDGNPVTVPEGNIILYKPFQRQYYSFKAKDNSVSCYIHFSGTECESILQKFGLLEEQIIYVGKNNNLEKIFISMENEFNLKGPFYTEACAGFLLQFLSLAGRMHKFNKEKINIKSRKSIDTVCKYMHEHYEDNNNLEFYADMCHLSEGRFSHIFKEHTGTSPKNYMLGIKMNVACLLLETTDMAVKEVAETVGIEDVNYFSRIMKKYTGHSPKYYR